ncbi:MAG: hypothetical protein JWN48_1138 [Myxococcaceae bacterium]|nr:hypothetical protein [Myxococcaceae bacterium]
MAKAAVVDSDLELIVSCLSSETCCPEAVFSGDHGDGPRE